MDIGEERLAELNALYKEHESAIDSIQSALQREIPLLVQEHGLSLEQTAALDEYIHDRVTIFRFLLKNEFSRPHTLSRMVDTIKWRINNNIGGTTADDLDPCFFENAFCFFGGLDRLGRPLLIIQLCHHPTVNGDAASFLTPFVTFVFETARRIMLETTLKRLQQGVPNPVVTETVLLVDFRNAKTLPRDRQLATSFVQLLRRFPSSTGTVCLLNFGWMYQGLWQMIKLLLSEQAKKRVCFPKVSDLASFIDDQELLQQLEMADPVPWDLAHDTVYKRLPPLGTLSRSSSSTSLYYDADLYTPSFGAAIADDDSSSEYATPRETTPVPSEIDLTKTQQHATTTDSYRHQKETTHLERRKPTSTTPSSSPARNMHFVLQLLIKMEKQIKHIIYRLANKIFQHRGTLYWIIACIIMRNRIMQVIHGILILVGQLFAKRLGFANPHSSGIRVLLHALTGQRWLL